MTATSPLTQTGNQIADLQARIQFLEADKRVQDLLIADKDAEIERLREQAIEVANQTIQLILNRKGMWSKWSMNGRICATTGAEAVRAALKAALER